MSLNYCRPTLNLLKVREEFCHRGLQNNKCTDQLAHPHSMISAFAIHKLNSIVFKLAPSKTSLFLSSLCSWEGWFLVWSYRKPWRQVLSHRCSYMHLYSCKYGPNPQTCFMWYAHTVLSKAPTFINILWECLTVHQISASNQFVMLAADHSCFQEILSKWAVYGHLSNMGNVMRKGVNKKNAQTNLHIHTVWSYLENSIMESFS